MSRHQPEVTAMTAAATNATTTATPDAPSVGRHEKRLCCERGPDVCLPMNDAKDDDDVGRGGEIEWSSARDAQQQQAAAATPITAATAHICPWQGLVYMVCVCA